MEIAIQLGLVLARDLALTSLRREKIHAFHIIGLERKRKQIPRDVRVHLLS